MTQNNQSALRSALGEVGNKWGKVNRDFLNLSIKYAKHKVLDVGCARGEYVRALSKRGHETFGIDIIAYPNWRTCTDPMKLDTF